MGEIVCIEPQAYSIHSIPANVLLTRQRSRSRSSASYSTSTHFSDSDCLIRVSSWWCHYAAVWTLILYLLVGGICMNMELIFLSIFQPGCWCCMLNEPLKLGMIQFTVTKWKLLFLPTYYLHDNKQTFISNCVYTCMLSVIEMIPSPQRSISANHRTFLSSVA